MDVLSISDIQGAIERCIAAEPPHGPERRLSKDASLLAEILGEMIYQKAENIPIEAFTGAHLEVYRKWARTEGANTRDAQDEST